MKARVTWQCKACAQSLPMTQAKIVAHLEGKHGVKATTGSRRQTLHTDGRDSFTDVFVWKIGGIELTQTVVTKRTVDDPMRTI